MHSAYMLYLHALFGFTQYKYTIEVVPRFMWLRSSINRDLGNFEHKS